LRDPVPERRDVPVTAAAVWALLRPLPPRYRGMKAMDSALRRLIADYLPFLQACARGALAVQPSGRGAGVFAGPEWHYRAGVQLPLGGRLTAPLSTALYGTLAREARDFSVARLPIRQRGQPPAHRLVVGPLALLNAGCARHARVLCRGRARSTVWRQAELLASGLHHGQQLLTRYGSETDAWRCPQIGCDAEFRG
jgi:hypothetical protein